MCYISYIRYRCGHRSSRTLHHCDRSRRTGLNCAHPSDRHEHEPFQCERCIHSMMSMAELFYERKQYHARRLDKSKIGCHIENPWPKALRGELGRIGEGGHAGMFDMFGEVGRPGMFVIPEEEDYPDGFGMFHGGGHGERHDMPYDIGEPSGFGRGGLPGEHHTPNPHGGHGKGKHREHHGDGKHREHHGDGKHREHHADRKRREHHGDGKHREHHADRKHREHHGDGKHREHHGEGRESRHGHTDGEAKRPAEPKFVRRTDESLARSIFNSMPKIGGTMDWGTESL